MLHIKISTTQNVLEEIASYLDLNVKDGVLTIPKHLGEGQIVSRQLMDGLFFIESDVCYFDDFILERNINEEPDINYFTLTYNFNFVDPTRTTEADKFHSLENSILFFNRHFSYKSYGPAYGSFKQIQFFISYQKLLSIIKYYQLPEGVLPILQSNEPWCYKQPFTLEIQRVLHQLLHYQSDELFTRGYMINKCEELIMLAFEQNRREILKKADSRSFMHEDDLQAIYEAEKKLLESQDDDFKVADIATQLSISMRKLQRIFKAYHGIGMRSYRKQVRMEQAKQMLMQQNLSITDICYKLGYSSVSHFSNVFKIHFGLSPSSLLNRVRL